MGHTVTDHVHLLPGLGVGWDKDSGLSYWTLVQQVPWARALLLFNTSENTMVSRLDIWSLEYLLQGVTVSLQCRSLSWENLAKCLCDSDPPSHKGSGVSAGDFSLTASLQKSPHASSCVKSCAIL